MGVIRKRHGLRNHPLYSVWKGMKQRCNDPNAENYKWYGEKGVRVCEEWIHDFKNFHDWCISNGWHKGLTVDRIDSNGNYCPENCKLSDMKQQCRNRRSNHFLCVDGIIKTEAEWAETLGINQSTIGKWIYRHNDDYAIKRIKEMLSKNELRGMLNANQTIVI